MTDHNKWKVEQFMLDLMDRAEVVVETKQPGCAEHCDLLDDIQRILQNEELGEIDQYRQWIDYHETLALRAKQATVNIDVKQVSDDTWVISKPHESNGYRVYRRHSNQWEIDELGGRFLIDTASSLEGAIQKAKGLLE